MKKQFAVLVAIAVLWMVNSVYAWDGHRQGFVLGIGVGAGNHWLTYEAESYDMHFDYGIPYITNYKKENKTDAKFGPMSDFKIGYAPTDQISIYWMSKVAWLYLSEGEDMVISGVAGAGASYYQKPSAPCAYFSGGIGYSSWQAPLSGDTEAAMGLGINLGAGYEFAKHVSFECNLTWGNPSNKNWDWDAKALAIRVTFNVLGY